MGQWSRLPSHPTPWRLDQIMIAVVDAAARMIGKYSLVRDADSIISDR